MKTSIISLVLFLSLVCVQLAVGVTNKTCMQCHDQSTFVGKVVHKPVRDGKCVTCHNPHVARYDGLLRFEGGKLCYSCHDKLEETFNQGIVHEPIARFQCTVCHTPHSSQVPGLVAGDLKKSCLRCHSSLKESYRFTHAPYLEGECGSCHMPHNSKEPMLFVVNKEKLCESCHDIADLQPKHKSYPGKLRMCLSCHNPHGSNRKSLVRNILHIPYTKGCAACHKDKSGRVSMETCLECHQKVAEKMKTTHNHLSQRHGNSCVNCHSPHASDDKMLLLAREKQVCSQCHRPSIELYKNSPYKHPSIENCTDCHFPHGGNDMALLKGNGLDVCALCHEDQGSFTHPVGPEVPDPRTGRMITCITCHNPMGTNYKFISIMEGKKQLCIQCHREY